MRTTAMLLGTGFLGISLTLVLTTVASAQAPAAPAPRPPLVVKQVKPGLFMIIGAGGNTTVRVTDAGLVLIDTKNPGQPIYDELMADVKTISSAPIKFVINTHMHAEHPDRTGPVQAARQQPDAAGAERTRRHLRQDLRHQAGRQTGEAESLLRGPHQRRHGGVLPGFESGLHGG
jgi:glyoxylase-like metal-dependent hydrolase (beta-lactamase superfamily II)